MSDIYVDESSQTKHRFLALGALIIPTPCVASFEAAIRRARLPELPKNELAWTKVSNAKLAAYKRVVDVFFDAAVEIHRIEFHSLHVDTSLIRDSVFNDGSRDVGFNKEVFQILRKCAKLHGRRLFHVYLDRRNTSSTTEQLRFILNCRLRKECDGRDWPFRRIHFRDSASCDSIQLVDVLLGSVTFRLNGHRDAAEASPAKCELSDYIKKRAAYFDAKRGTHRSGRFTIWERKLAQGGVPRS